MLFTPHLQTLIASQVRQMTGGKGPPVAFLEPKGDPGLFGPESMVWRVHAHFVPMLVGGLSSLLLQALHPLALAGVWDHSSFRQDLKARLGRTAFFIAATSYGGREMAIQAVNRVRMIHSSVKGTLPDGTPYRADDPLLLKWVHLGEILSFLEAYRHYGNLPVTDCQADQYINEMALLGELLGGEDLPRHVLQAREMLDTYRPKLINDERTKSVVDLIENFPARHIDQPFLKLIIAAAFHILPDWALQMLHKTPASFTQKSFVKHSLKLLARPVDWALDAQGVAAYSRMRVRSARKAD
jgi:uncharacterized protein (DUF2236 family)